VDTERQLFDNLNGTGVNKTPYLSDTPITGTQLTLSRQPGETRITNRLLLKGEVIGEFVDELIVPGYTFSWSPEELRLIAFRARTGPLRIMKVSGGPQPFPPTAAVGLRGWPDEGAAIASLERPSRKTFAVDVVELQQR